MIDIFRIQPFCTDPNQFGRVLNDHCAASPYEWIQLLDQDAMILCKDSNRVIENAIINYPDTDIFGAYTNRSGYLWQIEERWETTAPDLFRSGDIWDQIVYAKHLCSKQLCADIPMVAGFYMLFKKSYWEKNKFQEKVIDGKKTFDKMFCKGAKTMRIINGLYVFHIYRMGKEVSDDSHLRQGSLF